MRSARDVACSDDMGDRGCFGGRHDSECDARTEAIQQAREDGAIWERTRALRVMDHVKVTLPEWEDGQVALKRVRDGITFTSVVDVRNEAP